jgi:uncharacterized protein with ATP-grasp and redox domains
MLTAGVDDQTQMQTLRKLLMILGDISPRISPSEISNVTNRIIREETGIDDLYLKVKQESTRLALEIYPDLVDLLNGGPERLEQAVKISASGNVIDVVHMQSYNLWDEVVSTVNQPLLGSGFEVFQKKIHEVDHLLYLGDNSGETIFDRVLIESLDIPVLYAVKGGAILNDATHSEAVDAGLDRVAQIVETGSRGPGTILAECSPEFQQLFHESDLVLAKGQANYETLDREGDKVFFLLRIKCPIIGREIGYPVGNLVFEQGER